MKLSTSNQKTSKILISVIIPAHNEEKYIASCLQSVKSQKFNNFEIIVADNASTDKTALIAKEFDVRLISEPILGLVQTRETGRLAAKGEILVYVDADTLIPPDYLSKIFSFFQKHPEIDAVSNFYTFYDGNRRINFLAKILAVILPLYDKLLGVFHLPNLLFGGSFAVKKEILEKIGGFDTNLFLSGEDVDLAKRISQKGRAVFFGNIFSQTSARRYLRYGILRTSFFYIKSYLEVLFLDKPAEDRGQARSRFKIRPALRNTILIFFFLGIVIYGVAYPGSEIFGKTINHLKTRDKVVALTFDDGPNGIYTQEILDILDQNQIKATFFLIGENVERYPEIAKEITQKGNEIGNHSFSHPWLLPFKKDKTILSEVDKTQSAIFSATGVKTDLFRPPHGWRSPWMIKALSRAGYKIVTWNDLTLTEDFPKEFNSEMIAKRIVSQVKPGSIIDLHDGFNLNHGANRQKVIDALDTIIKEIKAKGYRFVLLNEIK